MGFRERFKLLLAPYENQLSDPSLSLDERGIACSIVELIGPCSRLSHVKERLIHQKSARASMCDPALKAMAAVIIRDIEKIIQVIELDQHSVSLKISYKPPQKLRQKPRPNFNKKRALKTAHP